MGGLKVKKIKTLVRNIGKIGSEMKNMSEDMTITPCRLMQWVKDERVFMALLSRVKLGEISLEEMFNEFQI